MRTYVLLVLLGFVGAACVSSDGGPVVPIDTAASPESTGSATSDLSTADPASPSTEGPAADREDAEDPVPDGGARIPVSFRTPAPEFPVGLDWLNTAYPLSLEALRGKIVVLDFWTYGCINCIHVIPDLERLEEEFADELVVIGVHSAKFDQESATENIRRVVLRYGVQHPVVNDAGFDIWHSYRVNAWPTTFVIDPGGGAVGYHSGEGVYEVTKPVLTGLVEEFADTLDRTPLGLRLERQGLPETVFSFPGKVTADPAGRLFISDTNHHRIVQTDLNGRVEAVYGAGEEGFVDGGPGEATFRDPQGTALSADGRLLYVADTNNHSVRVIDLDSGEVSTLVPSGIEAFIPGPDSELYAGTVVERAPLMLGEGQGAISLEVVLPDGYKVNPQAPSRFVWTVEGEGMTVAPDASGTVIDPSFPRMFDVHLTEGRGVLTGYISVVYCDADTELICLIEQVRMVVPYTVRPAGAIQAVLTHVVDLPDL